MIYFRHDIENNMIVAEHDSQIVEFTDTNETQAFYDSLEWHGKQPDDRTKPVKYTEEIWQKCLELSADITPKWLDAVGQLISFDDTFMLKRDDIGVIIYITRSWDAGEETLLIQGHSSETTDRIMVCCVSGKRTEGLYKLACSNLDMVKHLGSAPGSFFDYERKDS